MCWTNYRPTKYFVGQNIWGTKFFDGQNYVTDVKISTVFSVENLSDKVSKTVTKRAYNFSTDFIEKMLTSNNRNHIKVRYYENKIVDVFGMYWESMHIE